MPQAIEKKHGQRLLALNSALRSKALLLATLTRELIALACMTAALASGFVLLAGALSRF